ncbi:MAG: hypothetical protein OEU36_19625 [Gammaproteobacteria bacterium]|nr:hypothetical protein [Gammaproteobacteria bacterium]
MSSILQMLSGIVLSAYAVLTWWLTHPDNLGFALSLNKGPDWMRPWVETLLNVPLHIGVLVGAVGLVLIAWHLSVPKQKARAPSQKEKVVPSFTGEQGRIVPFMATGAEDSVDIDVGDMFEHIDNVADRDKQQDSGDFGIAGAIEHIDQMLYEQRVSEIGNLLRQAAATGDIIVSGEEYVPDRKDRAENVQIPKEYWETMEMDLLVCLFSDEYEPATRPGAEHEDDPSVFEQPVYTNLKVPKEQIHYLWPKARELNLARLHTPGT